LEEARDWTQQVRAVGEAAMNIGQIPDDELVDRLTEMRGLAEKVQTATQAALDGMVTGIERPILDGPYITELFQAGYISQSVEWAVKADGVPGTPVVPTPTPLPTERPTSTPVASPSPIPIRRSPTVILPRPTATVGVTVDATSAVVLPPTATPVPTPSPAGTVPLVPVEVVVSPAVEMPPTPGEPGPGTVVVGPPATATPVQAMARHSITRGQSPVLATTVPPVTNMPPGQSRPLPPQETEAFPVQRVAALVGAVLLGLVALWLRARL